MGHRDHTCPNPTIHAPNRPGLPVESTVYEARIGAMDLQQPESTDRPVAASLKATYRALLARGLEAGEAANLTAFLHGLPSVGVKWSLAEVEAIISRRIAHAAEIRAESVAASRAAAGGSRPASRSRRPAPPPGRGSRPGATHVIDPPAA